MSKYPEYTQINMQIVQYAVVLFFGYVLYCAFPMGMPYLSASFVEGVSFRLLVSHCAAHFFCS